MNKRIQKKMHKSVIGKQDMTIFEVLVSGFYVSYNKPENKYINLFIKRKLSKVKEDERLREQARQDKKLEIKERKKLSDRRTTAIANKLTDVELKIRDVFSNV